MTYCINLTESDAMDIRISLQSDFILLLENWRENPAWFDVGRLKAIARLYFVLTNKTWHMMSLGIKYYE